MSQPAFEKFAYSVASDVQRSDRLTPEFCEMLGNKAAQLALDARIPLSDAIVKTASDRPDLNNTHITNVCWVANNEYFRKVAAARQKAGQHLVFKYDLADPPDVVKQLNSMARPKTAYVQDPEYTMSPAQFQKVAFAPVDGPAHEKTAAVGPPERKDEPQDLGELRETLTHVRDEAHRKVASFQGHVSTLEGRLYRLFKTAAMEPIPLGHVLDLLSNHPAGDTAISHELSKIAEQMAKEDPHLAQRWAKTAGIRAKGIPDYNHPIYQTFGALQQMRVDLAKLSGVYHQAKAEVDYVHQAEKTAALNAVRNRIHTPRPDPIADWSGLVYDPKGPLSHWNDDPKFEGTASTWTH